MAWVTEYDLSWTSGDHYGSIWLQRDGGSYVMPLSLVRGSLEINDALPGWESHIIRRNCAFSILNDLSDFYALLPLMTISAGQIRVVVTWYDGGDTEIFIGFMNCETINQNMVNYSDIRFTASGLLDKLKYVHPPSIDTLQSRSLINLIDDCLVLTGFVYPIRVNCSLFEASNPLVGAVNTLFNNTAVFTELFWKDNIERMSALDILEMVLAAFNCYLYWYGSSWYIEHYEDLGEDPTKSYVVYASGGSYDWDNGGNPGFRSITPYDIHAPTTRPQTFATQILAVNPGLKQYDVKLDQKQFFNLLNGDLTNAVESDDPSTTTNRTWHLYDTGFTWSWIGFPSGTIANAMWRQGSNLVDDDQELNGITTKFKITVQYDTELTIACTYRLRNGAGGFPGNVFLSPEDFELDFNWFLQVGTNQWLVYTESTDSWAISGVQTGNVTTVQMVAFDQKRWTYELSLVFEMGDILSVVEGNSEDAQLTFRMGTELLTRFNNAGPLSPDHDPPTWSIWGDFRAAIDEAPSSNLFEGVITTDFLNKKTLTMGLFDTLSWSYKNALLWGNDVEWEFLTEEWGWVVDEYALLAEKNMESKFRLYRIARQRISVEYNMGLEATPFFIPLDLFVDNKQADKKFVIFSQRYLPDKGTVLLELYEYDDTETVTIT